MTAQLSAADSYPAENFCLISYADLPEFDPGFKYSRQILYQFSEINPPVSSEIKQDFIML